MLKFLILTIAVVANCQLPDHPPVGSGHHVTGGYGHQVYDWTVGKDSVDQLKQRIKAGNVYVKLHGHGVITIADNYWSVGDNTTIDGLNGQITIEGPKGLYIQKVKNVVVMGICFKDNETAVNMSAGGDKVWVHRNTFLRSAWGSPVAFSGWDCSADGKTCKKQSTELTISQNKFGPNHYGPLMFFGVGEATFYRNHFYHVFTRIPRAQNQGTFHVCNNVFEGWHLGLQGDDGAKFIYEQNVFDRVQNVSVEGSKKGHDTTGQKYGNNFQMNPKERIDVCWQSNLIIGDQKNIELKDGPSGGFKVTCDFPRPQWSKGYCSQRATHAPKQFVNEIKSEAGAGQWCRL